MRLARVPLAVVILTLGLGGGWAAGSTIIVNWDGSGNYTTVQAGLNAANDGDTVRVMPGRYREVVTFPNRVITLTSSNPLDPNVVAATILDGDTDQNPYTANGSVLTLAPGNAARTITGLTITGGYADYSSYYYGGGISGNSASGITISHCRIVENKAGSGGGGLARVYGTIERCEIIRNGAWYGGGLSYCTVTIRDCTISENTAYYGGGLHSCGGTISNCTISENTAYYGGGVYGSSAEFVGCRVLGNSAYYYSGGIAGNYSSTSISDSVIAGNTTNGHGGGAYSVGTIRNCVVTQNRASRGSGLDSCTTVTNTRIVGNGIWYDAPYDHYVGAGVSACGTLKDCLISGNRADAGGGVYNTASVRNCTIARNTAQTGSGLRSAGQPTTIQNSIIWYDSVADPYSQVVVRYSDIPGGWSGPGNLNSDPNFAATETGTWTFASAYDPSAGQTYLLDLEAAWVADELVGEVLNPDLSQGRQFVVAANTVNIVSLWGDASFVGPSDTYVIYNYRLREDSPCVDAGDPSFAPDPNERDLDGLFRISNGRVDMGAYEHQADCNHNGVPDWMELPENAVAVDNAVDARPIRPGITYTGTTVGATNDGAASCGYSETSPDVWYSYTPAANGQLTISLCDSAYDTVLSVHTQAPGTIGNELACNDDFCGIQSQLALQVYAGFAYYIRIAGYGGTMGGFTIDLTGPASAIPLAPDCNGNYRPDECDIAGGTSWDCNHNGVPDECEMVFVDCNHNGIPDLCDIDSGTSPDCNHNGIPDECDLLTIFIMGPLDTYPVYLLPGEVVAGDVNHDGYPDVLEVGGYHVEVLLNNGDGSLALPIDMAGPQDAGGGAVAADLDGDGWLDLATASNSEATVSIMLNAGAGPGGAWLGFGLPVDYPVATLSSAIGAGDLDNDGLVDVVVGHQYSHNIEVLPNLGTGPGGGWLGFGPAVDYPVNSPTGLAIGDLSADGHLDVAVINANAGTVSVMLNKGTGILKPAVTYTCGYSPRSVASADFNGDGRPDLAVTGGYAYATGWVSVLRNYGTGTFAPAVTYDFVGGSRVIVADLNHDGHVDTATVSFDADVEVLLNDSEGAFGVAVALSFPGASRLAAADLDLDGRADLVADYMGPYPGVATRLNQSAPFSEDLNGNGIPDECELHPGDANCDGAVNFDDINPFVLALSDPAGYQQQYPNCNLLNADCNGDGVVNFDDINPFVAILSGGG
jgi:hypothetical protein